MTRSRIGAVLAGLLLGASALAAQGTTTAPPKKSNPVRDSLRAVNKDLKDDKAERKADKAKGDIARAKAVTKDIKQDKKTQAALKKALPKKAPPAKP